MVITLSNGVRVVVCDDPSMRPTIVWQGPADQNPYRGRFPTMEYKSWTPGARESGLGRSCTGEQQSSGHTYLSAGDTSASDA